MNWLLAGIRDDADDYKVVVLGLVWLAAGLEEAQCLHNHLFDCRLYYLAVAVGCDTIFADSNGRACELVIFQ